MAEATAQQEPPTYYANVATMLLNVDAMTIEFRQYLPPHKDLFKTVGELKEIPAPAVDDVYKVQPVARVVLTFNAVRALKTYLDQSLTKMEAARRAGQ